MYSLPLKKKKQKKETAYHRICWLFFLVNMTFLLAKSMTRQDDILLFFSYSFSVGFLVSLILLFLNSCFSHFHWNIVDLQCVTFCYSVSSDSVTLIYIIFHILFGLLQDVVCSSLCWNSRALLSIHSVWNSSHPSAHPDLPTLSSPTLSPSATASLFSESVSVS